jgi:hypothetical protein
VFTGLPAANGFKRMRSFHQLPHYFLLLPVALTFTPAQAQDRSDSGPLLLEKTNRVKRKAITAPNSNTDPKINVSMTIVPVTVLDSMGRSLTRLGPHNFSFLITPTR